MPSHGAICATGSCDAARGPTCAARGTRAANAIRKHNRKPRPNELPPRSAGAALKTESPRRTRAIALLIEPERWSRAKKLIDPPPVGRNNKSKTPCALYFAYSPAARSLHPILTRNDAQRSSTIGANLFPKEANAPHEIDQ